jgi:hypothetical protein
VTIEFHSFKPLSFSQFNRLRATPANELKDGDKFFLPAALTAYYVNNETGAVSLTSGFYADGRWGTVKAITDERRRILVEWDDGCTVERDFAGTGPYLVAPLKEE